MFDFFRREPLVHFLGIAAVIFYINSVFSGDRREVITVNQATIDYLVEQEEDLRLRTLSATEREAIRQQFIDDEILVREARKRGFDDTSRIRTLLIQNMRFFVKQDLPAPSEEQLRIHFQNNIKRLTRPASFDLEQLYFEDAGAAPVDMLEQLHAGADFRDFGDFSLNFRRVLRNISAQDIATTFQREDAQAIVAIDDDQWHGPFKSAYGIHFLRVSARNPEQVPSYETGSQWLEMDWISQQQNALMEAALMDMRSDYQVRLVGSSESR